MWRKLQLGFSPFLLSHHGRALTSVYTNTALDTIPQCQTAARFKGYGRSVSSCQNTRRRIVA